MNNSPDNLAGAILLQSYSEQWNSVNDRLFIRMNVFDGLNDSLKLTYSASNLNLEFMFFTDIAEIAGVRMRAIERPPSTDDVRIRQAGVIISDVSCVKMLQGILKNG